MAVAVVFCLYLSHLFDSQMNINPQVQYWVPVQPVTDKTHPFTHSSRF